MCQGLSCDITEVLGIDDLHHPHAQLAEAQRLAAELYGAQQTFFLVNGSTVGNHAMLLATLSPGEVVLVPQGCHRSVFAGLLLSGARARLIATTIDPDSVSSLPPSLDQVVEAHRQSPEAKALFLTSPTYQGAVAGLERLAAYARDHGLLLLVDEAWGGHFRFSNALPMSAVEAGADLVVHSTHKMSGALTQGAMLHANGDRVDRERLKVVLTHLQTSSPSSLLVASLDGARRDLALGGRAVWDGLCELSIQARERLNSVDRVHCRTLGDPAKLLLSVEGYSGFALARSLREQHRIQVEMAELTHVLVLLLPGQTKGDIDRLAAALERLAVGKESRPAPAVWLPPAASLPLLDLRSCFYQPTRRVSLSEALDQRSAELLYCYPPGVPMVYPGQTLTLEILEHLGTLARLGGSVQGGSDPTLSTLKILDDDHD